MSAVATVATKPYRAFGSAVAMYLVFVVIGAAENVIAVRSPPSTAVVGLLAAATIFILVLALGARAVGSPRFPLGDFRRALGRVWWFWASGLLIAIAFTFHVGFPHAATRWAEWLLIGVVLAPLSEECAMRGVVQTSLNETLLGRREVFGLRVGTLIAAALFGCAHFTWLVAGASISTTLTEVISAVALGLVAGLIYQRSGNIWYGVLLHALGNLGGA